MKTYFLKLLYQILLTKIDEEPHWQGYTLVKGNYKNKVPIN